jgi:hypothetical protein
MSTVMPSLKIKPSTKFQTPHERNRHGGTGAELSDVKGAPMLFESEPEWQKEWKGMPEFVQLKQREYAKLIVRFRNQQDLDDFARLIGQKLNPNSQCTWHPELRPDKSSVKKYICEP